MMSGLWGDQEPPALPAPERRIPIHDGKRLLRRVSKENPCLRVFGAGPDDKQCKTCAHLFYKEEDKRYYKCELRGDTNGPGTDHRVRWPACAKYEEASA
jgi:hypothetical protein